MKYGYLFLLNFCLLTHNAIAQTSESPCTLQAGISIGICVDFPCVPLFSHVEGGTPPYQFHWFNGQTEVDTYFNYGTDLAGIDTCFILTVTDANGCVAIASTRFRYGGPPAFQPAPDFLLNDSIVVDPLVGTFEVKSNDHVFAQNYTLVQAPKHGNVLLNADGTGTYTPFPNWCGPDHFRYTATDTSGCNFGRLATVWIEQSPCGGILQEKTDCNNSCKGRVYFYQNGILTPPLSYSWSNGSTGSAAENLCQGPVSVTVTDAVGLITVYNATVETSSLEAAISAPMVVCNGTTITLSADFMLQNTPDYHFYWSGPGIYGPAQFTPHPTAYCYSNTDSAIYQLYVQSADGCVATTTWSIEMLPPLGVNLSVQLPKCPGDNLELGAKITTPGTPPYHYSWSGPKGIQSNWSELLWPAFTTEYNGIYALTFTDANGCSSVRKSLINIPDTCTYQPVIVYNSSPYCSGSDLTLQWGMSPNWVLQDSIVWTGPNGFFSNARFPTIQNIQPNMSGWYYITIQFGSSWVTDSSFFNILPDVLTITSSTITPPSECISPFNGVVSLEMNLPPPYQVKYSDQGSYQNFNSNPIVRSNVRDGFLTVNVKKNGCVASKTMLVETPGPPQLVLQNETCAGKDATIVLNAAHPFTTTWKLPDGSSLHNQQSLTGMAPGVYTVYAKDETTKCIFRDTFQLLAYLDFRITVVDTPTCTSTDGSLLVLPFGNVTPPIIFDWSNGFSGNPANNLAVGGYSVTLTDDDGCSRHRNTVLPPEEACIAQVTGRIYADTACHCYADSNSVIFPFVKVCATNGDQTTCTYAEYTGAYTLALTEPGSYTITATSYLPNAQSACTEFQYVVGQDVTKDTAGVDFFFCAVQESDLQVMINCGNARPGFESNSTILVRNNGIWTADTSLLTVLISPYWSNPVFSPQPTFYDPATHIANWRIPNLVLFQQFQVNIKGTVTAALGDTLTVQSSVLSLYTPDHYTANNSSECSVIVSGSFDPNDKMVNPLGIGSTGNISPTDSVLTYTIRFQNTGTDTAFTVVVRDTLDIDVFDLNSIRPLFSSHPYHLKAEGGNVLVFTFDPIQLPDSARSEIGSKGFVMFSIRLKNNLPQGSRIANSAAIYFDYNLPVITNTVQNTIVKASDPNRAPLRITLMPNPAIGQSLLSIERAEGLQWMDVALYSMDGAISKHLAHILAPSAGLMVPIDTRALPSGIYIVSVRSDLGQVSRKLIVISD
ncbi:MAG: T9SS type A sorting domain-containing protein [Phycisphaerae bacterium]|nr:T9SS type A sorting domain-containing protein [Saprospiraceae bacterium]